MAHLTDGNKIGYVRNLNPLQIRNLPTEEYLEKLLITEHVVHPESAKIIKGEPIYFDWIDRNSGKIKKPQGCY